MAYRDTQAQSSGASHAHCRSPSVSSASTFYPDCQSLLAGWPKSTAWTKHINLAALRGGAASSTEVNRGMHEIHFALTSEAILPSDFDGPEHDPSFLGAQNLVRLFSRGKAFVLASECVRVGDVLVQCTESVILMRCHKAQPRLVIIGAALLA